MKILSGHVSPETAFVVADYPYGFRLRCQIRYWLEHHPKRGTRLVSQTSNPKRGGIWNKPKASTYSDIAGVMFLDDKGHVQWDGLTIYSDAAQSQAWLDAHREGLPAEVIARTELWIAKKRHYEANVRPKLFPETVQQ
jgi:hypothetical protein